MESIVSESLVCSRKQILNFHCYMGLAINTVCHYFSRVLILVPSVDKKGKVMGKNV